MFLTYRQIWAVIALQIIAMACALHVVFKQMDEINTLIALSNERLEIIEELKKEYLKDNRK